MRVLIDVDGVLLRQNIYTPQADCIVEAVMEVAGPRAAMTVQTWDWVGRTDTDILWRGVDGMQGAGVALHDAIDHYLRLFRQRCPEDLSDQVNEPVVTAVREATEELGFSFLPVTGNLEAVARIKLSRAGVAPWLTLDMGGYGEQGARVEVLREAIERSGSQPSELVYIGDTRRDMAAANAAGVRFIGWETPKHRNELLEADWLVRNTDELMAALGDAAWCETVS
jgi:phosphoglycolate phosphatase-like HAD superfamily hydrolase